MKKRIFDMEQSIETEARKREDNTTELTENIEKELNKLHASIDKQKRGREETNKKLLAMIKDI